MQGGGCKEEERERGGGGGEGRGGGGERGRGGEGKSHKRSKYCIISLTLNNHLIIRGPPKEWNERRYRYRCITPV